MSDGASITGSPTIDRAIHWMSGNATTSQTNEARTRLDFDAAETPAPDQALLLRQHAVEANKTLAELEATVQRALLNNKAKDQKSSDIQGTAAPSQTDRTSAAIAALTAQVAMLTDMVGSIQAQNKADKEKNKATSPSIKAPKPTQSPLGPTQRRQSPQAVRAATAPTRTRTTTPPGKTRQALQL